MVVNYPVPARAFPSRGPESVVTIYRGGQGWTSLSCTPTSNLSQGGAGDHASKGASRELTLPPWKHDHAARGRRIVDNGKHPMRGHDFRKVVPDCSPVGW